MVYAKQKGVIMIETLLGINPAAIGAIIIAAISAVMAIFFRGIKAGKDSQLAKEGKAHAQTIKDIADANAARGNANIDRVSDDGFRRD